MSAVQGPKTNLLGKTTTVEPRKQPRAAIHHSLLQTWIFPASSTCNVSDPTFVCFWSRGKYFPVFKKVRADNWTDVHTTYCSLFSSFCLNYLRRGCQAHSSGLQMWSWAWQSCSLTDLRIKQGSGPMKGCAATCFLRDVSLQCFSPDLWFSGLLLSIS